MPPVLAHPSMKEIADVLTLQASGPDDLRLGELLAVSAGRVLLKAAKRGEDWRNLADEEKLRHIADWLKAVLVSNEAWLENVDGQGRPKKLMKFSSIEQIAQEADKAMLKAAQRLSSVKVVDGDEELIVELDDGFYLVRLLTPAALDRESSEMQHCIGTGGYDGNLERDGYLYLSLRDAVGKAHATLEIVDGTITQLQGKQNRPPIRSYVDLIAPYVRKCGYQINVRASSLGYVVDVHGEWHDIHSLPERLEVGGDLYLHGSDIEILPKWLKIGGDLSLIGSSIRALPEELTVDGSLCLRNTNISSLPHKLKVGKSINLSNTRIVELPVGFEVAGSLDLTETQIRRLPAGLKVGSHLLLRDAPICELPEGLWVGGDLELTNTQVRVLPERLTLGRSLFLEGAPISVLPQGLTVYGHLSLRDTGICVLPEGLKVEGTLNINGTKVTELPESISDDVTVYCSYGQVNAGKFRKIQQRLSLERGRLAETAAMTLWNMAGC